jgi:predicted Zn-dependent protease
MTRQHVNLARAVLVIALSIAVPSFAETAAHSDSSQLQSDGVELDPLKIGVLGLEYQTRNSKRSGEAVGIVNVIRVVKGGPAHLAGIEAGDEIEAVNSTTVATLTATGLYKLMQGQAGTVTNLTLKRKGVETIVSVKRVDPDALSDRTFGDIFSINKMPKLAYYYFKQGNFEEAAKIYRKLLSLSRIEKHLVITINNMATALEDEVDHWSLVKCDPSADNYLAECSQNGYCRWNAMNMPLKVYIEKDASVKNFDPIFVDILRRGFDEWSKASEGRVRFQFVDSPQASNIECRWTNDPTSLFNPLEGGDTKVAVDKHDITHATIQVLICNEFGELINSSEAKVIALHEIGHALGIIGHTRNPADMMFPSSTNQVLTARDRKTIADLYTLNEAVIAAKPQKRLR